MRHSPANAGAFAEFERELIRERVNAGLDRARKQGKVLGRPKLPPIKVRKVQELRQQGMSYKNIAKKTGVSVGKVHQIIAGA